MKRFVILDKKIGQTPLEALTKWKAEHPRYAEVPATYAGRLDPLASGKLLILLGEECKNKDHYMGLDKEYEVSVLLDITTDTGDVLGLPSYAGADTKPTQQDIEQACSDEVGVRSHQYPAYSSKTVRGVPLFMHTLRGTLEASEVPSHTESIYSIDVLATYRHKGTTVRGYIAQALRTVPRDTNPSKEAGKDFRQDEIREAWEALFARMPERSFSIIKIRVAAGTGAYMRTLAERIGETLGTSACALSIRRTRIGRRISLLGLPIWIRGW